MSHTVDTSPMDPTSPDAAATLYDTYGLLAFSLAYRIVGDWGIAEDVVQDAFLAIWRTSSGFDSSRGSMRSWLCQVVRNRALDRLRGTSKRQRQDVTLDAVSTRAAAVDVAADVVERDEARAVREALRGLPDAQREVIELAYFQGFTQQEIAGMTSRPLGTIKSRTRAAMRALADALAPARTLEASQVG